MWWSGRGSCTSIALCVKRCPCLASTHAIDAMVSPYLLDGAERVRSAPPARHRRDAIPAQARPPRDVLVRRN